MACGIGIEPDIYIAEPAEGAQVVYASRMVVVLVGDEHPVDAPIVHLQHLLVEVGAAVNEDALAAVRIHQRALTHALVVRVT